MIMILKVGCTFLCRPNWHKQPAIQCMSTCGWAPLFDKKKLSRHFFFQLNEKKKAENDAVEFLRSGGATNDDIDNFLDWCTIICGKRGEKARYEAYRLLARILRKRRSGRHYKKRDCFDFDIVLKDYLRSIAVRNFMNDPPRARSIYIDANVFVQYIVRHLDDGF